MRILMKWVRDFFFGLSLSSILGSSLFLTPGTAGVQEIVGSGATNAPEAMDLNRATSIEMAGRISDADWKAVATWLDEYRTSREDFGSAQDGHVVMEGVVLATSRLRSADGDRLLLTTRQSDPNDTPVLVDAGAVTEDSAGISPGDQIRVTGRWIKSGAQDLMVANSLEINGQPFSISPTLVPLRGRVLATKTAPSSDGLHRFVILESPDGRYVVDVGNDSQMAKAIQPGETYTFRGAHTRFRDQSFFRAHEYSPGDGTDGDGTEVVWRGLGRYVDTSPHAPTYPLSIEVMLGSKPLHEDASIDTIELSGIAYPASRSGNRFLIDGVPAGNYLLTLTGRSATYKPIKGEMEIVLTGAGSKSIAMTMDYDQ